MSYTIAHNCAGRPINFGRLGPNSTTDFLYGGRSGSSPYQADERGVREFVHSIERYGHAIVRDNTPVRPSNHYIIGCGVGHDDAEWCESRFVEGSMAAYYESGEPYGGRRIAALVELERAARRRVRAA